MATLIALPAKLVSRAHTALSATAFLLALAAGYLGGIWEALCENSVAKWPVEWFPSVSATIGDHAASRAPFHIAIALTAFPRFTLLALQWVAHRYPPRRQGASHSLSRVSSPSTHTVSKEGLRNRKQSDNDVSEPVPEHEAAAAPTGWADVEAMCGLGRTFCCGGWMYITSRDHHDLHDLFMIVYLVLNVPWMVLSTLHSTTQKARRWRTVTAAGFILSIPPLIYLFIKHSVRRVPGAYTQYAFFEWGLVFWDVMFDAGCLFELGHLQVRIVDTTRGDEPNKGANNKLYVARVSNSRPRSEEDWTANPSSRSRLPYPNICAYLSDVWFATVFWTLFTGVSVQLFYWSVWSLSLTGSELAVLINLAPHVMTRRSYRAYAMSREGQFTHRALMCGIGLACYALPSVATRFICVVAGVWCGWAMFMADTMRVRGSPEMVSQAKIFTIGLLICMLAKYQCHSNNPFWAIVNEDSGGWNKTGLLLSVLALAEYYYRPNSLFPAPPVNATLKDKPAEVTTTRAQRYAIIFGLGSLIHLLQTFVCDPGTIIAWSWTGYPATGPLLHPWGGVTIAVAAAGAFVHFDALSPATWAIPFLAAVALFKQGWIGYVGGLVLVFYLVAIVPTLFRTASALPPAVWGHAGSWLAFLNVASVLTVAYAFVPMGWILRERSDIIMALLLIPLPFALHAARALQPVLPGRNALQARSTTRVRNVARWSAIAALVLGISGLFKGFERASVSAGPKNPPTPYYPEHNIFTGGIYTVHFGIDEPGRDSQRRIASLIEEMQVDVLGMLETDLHRFVYGNRDLTRYIAEELGYYVDIGPGPNGHTWGAALLSKFPIMNSTHHLLPSPNGELAPAIHATLDVRGQRVDVVVSHNGQEEDPLDRELQTRELADMLHRTGDTPTVFLGYLVTRLGAEAPNPYGLLFNNHSGLIDVETLDRWRWCEYIGFRGLWRIAFARLEHGTVTDTELQVAKFVLPLPGQKVKYAPQGQLYWHIAEADVPAPWRMPQQFRGKGVRGHSYRIWDGPLYYLPPLHSGVRAYGLDGRTDWPPAEAEMDIRIAREQGTAVE
ncbi:hypothetical protein CspeluHIS016_0702870 [Cutaneotrichosporon spelunceum]|uniref:Frag1/DRAM/Sfk1 family-domain-containing protein n=1 Tax=Cutaneotrichosporon spelunceum TaxID=1672016 RepID=A0AAD3YER7_9TREE|nr:hypothetical protein CspeluHIS016_0702870 [Cutaneotrichosporon spelunceum]